MAHQEQIDFCRSVKQRFPHFFSNRLVIDIGSLDVNGNNQYLFEQSLYLGIDLMPGKNVDLVSQAHELNLPTSSADVIISTECLEHDQYYALTLKNIIRMLKPGGALILTCATTGRPEHGTRRTSPQDAPFIHFFEEWGDYYKNLDEADIRAVLDVDAIFADYEFSINPESQDLYFWGIKQGDLIARKDYSFQIETSIASVKQAVLNEQLSNVNTTLIEQQQELVALKHIIESMYSSTSWRFTKPLRFLSAVIRRSKKSST